MNKGLWNRLLKGMKNDELATLSLLTSKEQHRRAEKRVREGRFSELEDSERDLLLDGRHMDAVLAYKKRTNCPVVMAKMVVDLADAPVEASNVVEMTAE